MASTYKDLKVKRIHPDDRTMLAKSGSRIRTDADQYTMSQQWWQETAEELAAKVRGYFTNGDGKVEILENCDGDWDLYRTASRLTTRTVQPGGKNG